MQPIEIIVIVLAVFTVVAVAAGVVIKRRINRKKGVVASCCDCAHCPHCSQCRDAAKKDLTNGASRGLQ